MARLVNWSKFKYLLEKKEKKKRKSIESKEWIFNAGIAKRDIENKLNNIKKFLKKGGRVKIVVIGRKKQNKEMIKETMDLVVSLALEFADKVSEIVETGNNMSVFIKYKVSKNTNEKQNTQINS